MKQAALMLSALALCVGVYKITLTPIQSQPPGVPKVHQDPAEQNAQRGGGGNAKPNPAHHSAKLPAPLTGLLSQPKSEQELPQNAGQQSPSWGQWWRDATTGIKITDYLLTVIAALGVGVAWLQWQVYQQQTGVMLGTQRAILNVRRMRAYEVMTYNKPVAYIAFVPEIENVGIRPTFECVASTHYLVLTKVLTDAAFNFLPVANFQAQTSGKPAYRGPFPRYFGPKAVTDGPRIVLKLTDVQAAHADAAYLYVWGWLDYNDGFKGTERRRTEFAFEVIVIGDPLHVGDHTFRFTMLGRHNGADEGCYRYPTDYAAGLAGHLGPIRPAS